MNFIDLNRYNVLIMPSGSYNDMNDNAILKTKSWIEQGGTLIALKNAALWATKNELGKTRFKKDIPPDSTLQTNYAGRQKRQSLNAISGVILKAIIDNTHPLCYGYLQKEIPLFKTGNTAAESLNINYSEPVKFSNDPFISGFVSEKNLERLKNAPVVSLQSYGKGKLITYHESMNFRGYWAGTNKLFMNAVFFGNVIR